MWRWSRGWTRRRFFFGRSQPDLDEDGFAGGGAFEVELAEGGEVVGELRGPVGRVVPVAGVDVVLFEFGGVEGGDDGGDIDGEEGVRNAGDEGGRK